MILSYYGCLQDIYFSFVTIRFEEVVREPGFNFIYTVREEILRKHGSRFGGQVELGVIHVAVKMNIIFPENITKGKSCNNY